MALSTDDCTQQQQVYSTDCMNPTFSARRQQLSSSSPPTPPLPPPPLFPLTPAENVESLPPHHDNESFDDSPPKFLSHKPLRGEHHCGHITTGGGIQGYPSPPSAGANHSTTTTNLDDTPYDLLYDYPYPHFKHPTAALFGGHHVSGFPSRLDTIMMSTPSSMAVSTPSLSPSSPLSVFNDQQSPLPPPPYPASAPGSARVRRGNGLELSSEEDADALLSPLSPEWGATALTATDNVSTTTAARHGILGLPTHSRNIEQPRHRLLTSTLLPPSSTLSPILSPSEPLGEFDELLVPMGSDRGASRFHDQTDDLGENISEEDDDDRFPPFLNLSTFDAAGDDLLSASASAFTSRPILSLLDIPPPRSGTTTATRSRATSRSRSRSPFWEYPPLPRSSTPSVAGVRDYGDDDDENEGDVDRVGGEGDADMSLDGRGEDGEFIVSPPSSGPPDTPSTPTDLPALPFLDLFDDDEDEELIPECSQKRMTQHDTNEDIISIPGYFPHPTSPSISVHRDILPPYEHEDQNRDFVQQLWDSPPRSGPERPNPRKEENWLHQPPSPSPPLLSLPPPFASFSPLISPPLLPHASPRPALLQLSFDDEDDLGLEGSSGAVSPPFSPDNNSLRLLLHNSPPRSPPHPSSTSPSMTRSPSPELYYDNILTDLGVGQGGEYAEEVKKLVELQKRAREAERVAREREGLVMAALQARRGVRLAASASSDASSSTPSTPDESNASLLESTSAMSDDEKKTENEEMALLQRAAVEARSVAKRERERAKEVGMLLRLKLGDVSEGREGDTRMDTEDATATTADIENIQDTDTPTQLAMSATTSPASTSTSTLPLLSELPSPPTTTMTATIAPKTGSHPRMASIAQLVAKMFLSRHEASPSSASISVPALPPPPTALSPPSTTTEATTTSSSSAPSSTSMSSSPITSILRSSSSPAPSSSSKYRNLWLKGLAGSSMLGRLGGTGTGADRFLQSQLQQRYKFLRSSPLARNASSIHDDDDDGGPNGGDEGDREERDVDGGFEALRRPIMWGMDLGEDEELGLLPAL